ncbi:MAG: hypothetical protein ACFFEN_11450 [Candidatus Thorarchaeota archaeon]
MSHNKKNFDLKRILFFLFICTLLFFPTIFINTNSSIYFSSNESISSDNNKIFKNELCVAKGDSILLQGIESPLKITETGNLYKFNQGISASSQEEVNISYYLDDVHDWKVSEIQNSIRNIQDTREWVNNSDFLPIITFSKNVSGKESSHNYQPNRGRLQTLDSIIAEPNTIAMRVHFTRFEFEDGWDYFLMEDENNTLIYVETGNKTDYYSPWIWGSELNFYFESDGIIQYWGYKIDFYEFINASSNFYINSPSWEGNSISSTRTTYGNGNVDGVDSMFVALYSEVSQDTPPQYDATYYEGDFVELYQNITIPRGRVIDAYISFDYYAEFTMDSNENFIYCAINNKRIYSKGMADVVDLGRKAWHHTGKINIDLWLNTSNIFDNIQNNNDFNISVGIMSGASVTYSGFDDRFQQVFWFDNLSLELTTIANSTQNDINLTINSEILTDGSQWGFSSRNFTGIWENNPLILTFQTTSPSLKFDLDTILYGFHDTQTKIGQTIQEGITYKILENGSVYWEFTHNFYMPSQYADFEFTISKPTNWEITLVLDPTLQSVPYEGGNYGDTYLTVNTSYAIYPGWWSFLASSPNYINISNTEMYKQGQWGETTFLTGETTKIRTQINYSNEIPSNVDLSTANLTIYDPTGSIWYQESIAPYSNGTVIFSEIIFSAINTTGGRYNFTIFWSNGTSVGGIKSNFIINHQSSLILFKPDDAKLDLRTEGFVGDIIPIRVYLQDIENNQSISNSIISYNWTDGIHLFSESALGIYETVLDTADLLSRGLYNIIINSSKIGFLHSNITLEINLGEETNLQVLESEYNIELHANTTIRFKFTDFDGDGIDGALVDIGISDSSLYSISNLGNGIYNIEFSTLFINETGIYQLRINFSAVAYEPQYYIYQFQIIKQSVELSVYINSEQISENSLRQLTFNEEINISVRAISILEQESLTGGVISCIGELFTKNLTEYVNHWFNATILCSSDNFSLGINIIYLQFEHPNYRTATFGFQLLINQVKIKVNPLNFEDPIYAGIGDKISIQFQLLDNNTNDLVVNASVSYSWAFDVGEEINETTPGTYQLDIKLKENVRGSYKFELIIRPRGSIYESTKFSFLVIIGEPIPPQDNFPSLFLWIIIGVLVSVAFVLGILSVRSYVILPRKRRKGAELLSKTQRFKDMINIQAIVVIHRFSGIPIYSKSYSILERHKKELFSGFIQAITTIGEEFTEKEVSKASTEDVAEGYGIEKIIELDFKYFYCLIADKGDVRVVFVLKEKSSERLKNQISSLISALTLKLSIDLDNWDGSLDTFEKLVPPIIEEYFELYYKGSFTLSERLDLIKIRKERDLSKMEIRVLNVVESLLKRYNNVIQLNYIIEMVSEENKDLVMEAVESLLVRKMIVPIDQ